MKFWVCGGSASEIPKAKGKHNSANVINESPTK